MLGPTGGGNKNKRGAWGTLFVIIHTRCASEEHLYIFWEEGKRGEALLLLLSAYASVDWEEEETCFIADE